MKTFKITRTTVETFEIEAETLDRALSYGERMNPNAQDSYVFTCEHSATELLPEPAYRVRIVADEEEYQHGDYSEYDEDTETYTDVYTPDSQESGEARVNAQIGREGQWGFIVEKRTEVYGEWEEEDSCWGFIGSDIDENGMAYHIGADVLAKAEVIYE